MRKATFGAADLFPLPSSSRSPSSAVYPFVGEGALLKQTTEKRVPLF